MTQHNHARVASLAWDHDSDNTEALTRFDLPTYIVENHPGCKMTGEGNHRRCVAIWRDGERDSVALDREGGTGKWLWDDHVKGEGGNAWTFLTQIDRMTSGDAWELIRGRAGIVGRVPRAVPQPQAHYPYLDEAGTLLFRVVRKVPKGFYQQRPDGKGGWLNDLKGVRRVPYRLPEILPAPVVYVVEGEKDADRLHAGGLVATCNAGGANKGLWTSEHAQHLAGKAVVVLGDNDEKGRAHVARVIKSLVGVASSIKVPQLDGLPDKGDVSDWLDAGHTIDDLRELVAATPEWSGEAEAAELGDDLDDDQGDGASNRSRGPRARGNVPTNLDTVSEALQVLRHRIGTIYHEAFSGKMRVTPGPVLGGEDRPFGDLEALRVTCYLQREHHMGRASDDLIYKAALLVADENRRDALTEWLDGLAWDGVERLATWLVSAYGVDDTNYTRRVGWNWLVSMVARAYTPGEKVDTMPILEGAQGIGKSRSLQALVPAEWYVDGEFKPDDKDFLLAIRGRWLVENGELHGLNKSAQEAIKRFLSCQFDVVRPPYHRDSIDIPRRCVMVGTTNEAEYLSDPTGARRFWPIKCRRADVEWIAAHRDQLWAEAVAMYRSGSNWHHMPDEAQAEQEARRVSDPWEAPILRWLNDAGRINRREFAPDEILSGAVELPIERHDRRAEMRLSGVLTSQGWTRRRDPAGVMPRVKWWCRPQA